MELLLMGIWCLGGLAVVCILMWLFISSIVQEKADPKVIRRQELQDILDKMDRKEQLTAYEEGYLLYSCDEIPYHTMATLIGRYNLEVGQKD
jgi:hypothetical protein